MSYLEDKCAEPEALAKAALEDEKVLQDVLNGVLSKSDVVRQNSFQTLHFLSENRPESIYGKWDFFADLIRGATLSTST